MNSYESICRFRRAAAASEDCLVIAHWNDADWASFAALCQPLAIEAGDALITTGYTEQSLFLVCAGAVEVVHVARPTLTVSTVSRVPAGSIVGEQAFFDASPRSANVWALDDCELLRIDLPDYQRYAQTEARRAFDFSFALGRVLAQRLRATTARIGA